MESLTLLFFLLSLGLFVLAAYRRKMEVVYLSEIVGVLSLVTALEDSTIGDAIVLLVIVDAFTILLGVTWILFPREDERCPASPRRIW